MSDINMPAEGMTNETATTDNSETRQPTFFELGVPKPIVRALADDDKTHAFPIQADTLPDSLNGRDILGRGATGSGKTLAFSIPLVARISERAVPTRPRALVLAPTRELVNQIDEVLMPLAHARHMRTTTIYGGVRQNRQVNDLRRGADIVVACPGRLQDLINQHRCRLDDVEVVVIDEADEMADMGFLPEVTKLLEQVPEHCQHMLFSATLDHDIDSLVKRFLHEPKIHEIDSATAQVETMTQHVFQVSAKDKPGVVEALASGKGKRIMFTRTKNFATELTAKLIAAGIPTAELQGDLSQSLRERNMQAFRSGEVHVMVATDVAARGMDISGVELVVQIDPPRDPKSFLHRSGRTARAGRNGDVVTLVTSHQRRGTARMLRRAGIDCKFIRVTADSPEVLELMGEKAPLVEGWELPMLQPKTRKPRREDSRGGRGERRRGERNFRSERRGERRDFKRDRFERDDRRADRKDFKHDRFEKFDKFGKFEKFEKKDRFSKSRSERNRPERDFERFENGEFRRNRFEKKNHFDKQDRFEGKRRYDEDNRFEGRRRDNRFEKDGYGKHHRSTKRDYFDRNDRFERSDRFERDSRFEGKRRNDRFNKTGRSGRQDRFGDKDFGRNDRSNRGNRRDRFERNDRGNRRGSFAGKRRQHSYR
ncbi:DEAD/DEAH box helicase [Bifidobacterium primatium]|uniref:DEAD/DEAH box helicase n=1 Tax=Bifidobacterium primatium TaxID=2045438 RepID=A0A2M9HAT5_9BIFI|nr:DEAD/DEAH box helicase [Bifidobacterium primatium]PJM73924.1 DEAD/DEAH box helicase [Bifidobacterium primatium]